MNALNKIRNRAVIQPAHTVYAEEPHNNIKLANSKELASPNLQKTERNVHSTCLLHTFTQN
jgi:hypothetical protein